MKNYKHLFFDLDRTLWDFDRNTAATLAESLARHELGTVIPDAALFIEKYHRINLDLWTLYRKGKMTKQVLRTERFYRTLLEFGIDDRDLAGLIGDEYLDVSPTKTILMPGTKEVLEYLERNYQLYILSNGFQTTQTTKLACSGLDRYFSHLITSEKLGVHKPDPRLFRHALGLTGAALKESLMIGDDLEVDIQGARNAGMDQIWFNPDRLPKDFQPTFEIQSLRELKNILPAG